MSSNHFAPAARGHRHRRQLARLPSSSNEVPPFAHEKPMARSPGILGLGSAGDDDEDLLDIPGLGGIAGRDAPPGFTQSATTIVNSVALPFTTILETNVATVLVPIQSTNAPTSASTPAPVQQSNTQTQTTSTQTSSSAQSSSAASSSGASTSSANSSSANSASAASSSANPSVTPPPSSGPSALGNGNSLVGTHTVSSTVTSSATPTSGASQASTATKGLSGGAIGGIVAVSVIAAIIMLVWVVRKLFLRRRAKRRETFVWPKADFGPDEGRENDISEKMFVHNDGTIPPPVPDKPMVPTLTPPPMSYNNPAMPPISAPVQSPTLTAGGAAVSLSPASAGVNYACVRCTYIPNLPDELSVTVGETVRVLNEYDDGWALCLNMHNEQGVVPLECLDRSSALAKGPGHYLGQGTGDWRMSRRASSLNGGQAAAAVRY